MGGGGGGMGGGGGGGGMGGGANVPGRRLFITNLPYELEWQQLKDHFRSIGPVTYATIMKVRRRLGGGQDNGGGAPGLGGVWVPWCAVMCPLFPATAGGRVEP
jgi:hypothetical protein